MSSTYWRLCAKCRASVVAEAAKAGTERWAPVAFAYGRRVCHMRERGRGPGAWTTRCGLAVFGKAGRRAGR